MYKNVVRNITFLSAGMDVSLISKWFNFYNYFY